MKAEGTAGPILRLFVFRSLITICDREALTES
jgi:hypothetical protein